ncbi:hypothetical protein R1sor_023127 [Riccia sorocarpa]|uniref:Reverse transcriptase domain-containing protein n=1 Tax=Riccia sorocarpa TaxID=122646 RepID=A0ABD3GQR1_9MARC
MVESQEDSIGPSPLLRRDELHSWEFLAGRADLIDAQKCATRILGPHFTRQAWHGNRFDQSRLDRFYLKKRGEWVYHIRTVEHQGARTLSDHVPIKLEGRESSIEILFREVEGEHANEEMMALETESGQLIEEGDDILDAVQNFYKKLYEAEEETEEEECSRQGCPLAPLLFVMKTQPLMRALREEERRDAIQGLNIGGGESLLHQLFADDTGICITAEEGQFGRLKEVIREFESSSGASLNLQKSIVMKPGPQPEWMNQTGCEIAGPRRSFKYLGIATSSPIDEKTITEEILQKIMKKLKHWSNRLLSWPAKTLLLKHVLAATPLYHLMSVGLCKDGLEELERLCRNFLWGWNEEGNPKHALVAWEQITQEKDRGGLGWTNFRTMAEALNVRLIGRILEGGNAEWIQIAKSFILKTLRKGAYQRECCQWTLQESLILLPLTRIDGSPTLMRILGSWYRARKRLRWKKENGKLDGRLSIFHVKAIHQLSAGKGVGSITLGRELGLLRRMRISNLREAMEISRREGWIQHLRRAGVFPEEDALSKLVSLEDWCRSQRLVQKGILALVGWSWEASKSEFSWIQSTRDWRQLLIKDVDFTEKLEERWQGQSQILT